MARPSSKNAVSPLEMLFNHLVLPPRLPGAQDDSHEDLPHQLIARVEDSLVTLDYLTEEAHHGTLTMIEAMLQVCRDLNRGRLDRASLVAAFGEIEQRPLVLHVVAQNAALIIRHEESKEGEHGPSVVFEAFEASPESEQVLAAQDALLCTFPSQATRISLATFQSSDFQESLANFLEMASIETFSRLAAKSRKANTEVTEERDTSNPALITQMLIPFLETIGTPFQVPLLRKRVRDDVSLDSPSLPWRRHPFWLILRVAVQRILYLSVGEDEGRVYYKFLKAILLAQLLQDCLPKLKPDLSVLLRSKLCRHLAKLELERKSPSQKASAACNKLFACTEKWFKESISSASKSLDLVWKNVQTRTTRAVPKLMQRAPDKDTQLTLPCSRAYLNSILQFHAVNTIERKSINPLQLVDEGIKRVQSFTKRYFALADHEQSIKSVIEKHDSTNADGIKIRCNLLAEEIDDYIAQVTNAYDTVPEQKSAFLLTLFQLWVELDGLAIRDIPLLVQYRPVFNPNLLEALQLLDVDSLVKVQDIQQYLHKRITEAARPDIFAAFGTKDSFGNQYLMLSANLQAHCDRIQGIAKMAKDDKQAQWREIHQKYQDLATQRSKHTCLCTDNGDSTKNIKNCVKCYLWRKANRLEINIFEEYLPNNRVDKANAVFELCVPPTFQAYRNATFSLMRLAWPTKMEPVKPLLILADFKQLAPFFKSRRPAGISLASDTKAFSQTHYKAIKVSRNSINDVLLPFGPRFSLFDSTSNTWVKVINQEALTLQHHCAILIPQALRDILPAPPHPPAVVEGPTSYHVMANQNRCPQQASPHEFSAYQTLLFGPSQRWITILTELGSSNLNFSNGETARFLADLALQTGPSTQGHIFRDAHSIFADKRFCQRLIQQIEKRLVTISSNFREANVMELLLTLSERLYSFSHRWTSALSADEQTSKSAAHKAIQSAALSLIKTVRTVTLQWVVRLREELRNAKDADTNLRITNYGFRASILTRRTFSLTSSQLNAEDLSVYCQASIALQDFMVAEAILESDPVLKALLIRDTKMAWSIRHHIEASVAESPDAVHQAISKCWGTFDEEKGGEKRGQTNFFEWVKAAESWVTCRIVTPMPKFEISQVVHFNFVEGYLLVDGKPLGRLPESIRQSPDIKTLFGDAYLLTYECGHHGMSHRLATSIERMQVYFGARGNDVIIRTVAHDTTMEFVPARTFTREGIHDLPLDLIEGCVHWVDLKTKRLHIRRRPIIWRTRPLDWKVDLRSCIAQRGTQKPHRLIDPFSLVAQQVAKIFEGFVRPEQICMHQPLFYTGHLIVELPRLELYFRVNHSALLEEPKLKMVVDPSQDAGTFYGLKSKLVLRDVSNVAKRSLLVPDGVLTQRIAGTHVEILIESVGQSSYLQYDIDETVGRLVCKPEPLLVYRKAYLHAVTSSPLPEPLTGRTGIEESIRILESGMAQPWMPVGQPVDQLKFLASLAPHREYYPKDKRRLQQIQYGDHLSNIAQHDQLAVLAKRLLNKSGRLEPFFENANYEKDLFDPPDHLRLRGIARRRVFEPVSMHTFRAPQDMEYKPRDQSNAICRHARSVYEITKMLFDESLRIPPGPNFRDILHAKDVGGFPANTNDGRDKISREPIIEQFGALIECGRKSSTEHFFHFAIRLAILAFDGPDDKEMHLIRLLVAFARVNSIKTMTVPAYSSFYGFRWMQGPKVKELEQLMLLTCPDFNIKKRAPEERGKYMGQYKTDCNILSEYFYQQWPREQPTLNDSAPALTHLPAQVALEAILPTWAKLRANWEFCEYLESVTKALEGYLPQRHGQSQVAGNQIDTAETERPQPQYFKLVSNLALAVPYMKDLAENSTMPRVQTNSGLSALNFLQKDYIPDSTLTTHKSALGELKAILQCFVNSADPLRQRYGEDLATSLSAMNSSYDKQHAGTLTLRPGCLTPDDLSQHIKTVQTVLEEQHKHIVASLAGGDGRFQWLHAANLWPGTDTATLLEQLRSSAKINYGPFVKEQLVQYAVTITLKQWLGRVRHAILKGEMSKLSDLLSNIGHENWDPTMHTDWLLMEIEADMLIRPKQIAVARQIISPESKANSVLQLNMGQGKTSCIVPLAIAVLADQSKLVRLICPKALILPTAQVIQSRIGGLVGREMRHIPYARRTATTEVMIQLYDDLHKEIRESSGLILTTPDAVLSHRLSSLQRLVDGEMVEASRMIKFSEWMTEECRDIIDESDLTLGVKTQLVYPSGPRIHVDGAPQRWEVAESLLLLVAAHLPAVRASFPRGLEISRLSLNSAPSTISGEQASPGFYIAHFLQLEAEDELNRLLVEDICTGHTPFLRPSQEVISSPQLAEDFSKTLRWILTEPNYDKVSLDFSAEFFGKFAEKELAPKIVLLLRGLLLNRIFVLCLKKRWGVQYGLHPAREPIAVPYEAKGLPSDSAEFGHPDVSIILTILSYLYGGVSLAQFQQALTRVLASDDPAVEYDRFISGSTILPEQYRHASAINTDDAGQVDELHQHLRLDSHVCFYYLNTFVFPVHAKAFSTKLSASSWDIPLYPKADLGKPLRARTTGFSGTNDNKSLLPLTIAQEDLPSLVQTNAEVLTYLLQPRNRQYQLAAYKGQRLSEVELLGMLKRKGIKVLIDTGAYILEMTNQALAKAWLEVDYQARAAVFFDQNRAVVMSRDGAKWNKVVPLVATPWAENITSDVLVFFDEAHCRGVDLKLPIDCKAALTLALSQTKDHTVQGAMRLRELASRQSVVFFGPPEVDASIRDVCNISSENNVHSGHVVRWLLEMTCRNNEQLQDLHIAHGVDFCRRLDTQWANARFLKEADQRSKLFDVIQAQESQTLEQQYGWSDSGATKISENDVALDCFKSFMHQLAEQRNSVKGKLNGRGMHNTALEEVERERQVEHQVEEVRQVAKAVKYKPLDFPGLSAVLEGFVKTGKLGGANGYMHVFDSIKDTAIGRKFEVKGTGSRLYCSVEFSKAIKVTKAVKTTDGFLRPVRWILWNPTTETAMVIIPEEAELLISKIRLAGSLSPVHLIAFAAPVTKTMKHFDDLKYYTMPALSKDYEFPAWFKLELGFFAGRLYVPHHECVAIAKYLGIPWQGSEPSQSASCAFTSNPMAFLQEWLALRRQVQDIMQTPMGYIISGRPLAANHPFFANTSFSLDLKAEMQVGASSSRTASHDEDDEDEDEFWSEDEAGTAIAWEGGEAGVGQDDEKDAANSLGDAVGKVATMIKDLVRI